jgi:hypothetical protein
MTSYFDELFPVGTPTLLTGVRGSGKTTFAFELCKGNLTSLKPSEAEVSALVNRVIAIEEKVRPSFIVFDYDRMPIDENSHNQVAAYFETIKTMAQLTSVRVLFMICICKDVKPTGASSDIFRRALHIHKEDGVFYVTVTKHDSKDILGTRFTFGFNKDGVFKQTGVIVP